MRHLTLAVILAGAAWGQNLTEFGAAAAGGSVGGASGRKVSDGISAIMNKVSGTTEKATAADKAADKAPAKPAPKEQPALVVSQGVPKGGGDDVPPPPEAPVVRKAAPAPAPPVVVEPPPVAPPPPPPPQMTADNLKGVASGTSREELLKLGVPAARITMIEDGHLVETYTYLSHGESLGSVRLSDGAVASVKAR